MDPGAPGEGVSLHCVAWGIMSVYRFFPLFFLGIFHINFSGLLVTPAYTDLIEANTLLSELMRVFATLFCFNDQY